jgi:hypothetical protein
MHDSDAEAAGLIGVLELGERGAELAGEPTSADPKGVQRPVLARPWRAGRWR